MADTPKTKPTEEQLAERRRRIYLRERAGEIKKEAASIREELAAMKKTTP